ncbi:MAG: hypothetical protein HRU48_20545 [Vibrio sp.]|uniref:hypothetical protein n=1 Tax=Vibrio sp. TaxID=678 RepID=UPI001EC8C5C7|nr:hypothetical protein [Vibrio sp.]NRB69723.1 hypothetical protein [Vibrio sp.]
MANPKTSNIKVSGESRTITMDTASLFNQYEIENCSPIDLYVKRTKATLRKIGELERAGSINVAQDRDMYNLFLLGMVSNVESFFRSVLREIILVDTLSYNKCLDQQLTYAAAMHHRPELMPEALLEQCTFISLENIRNSTKTFLGIPITQSPDHKEVVECISRFEQLCHLRHCIVHRAGLLGSKNAVKLGIEEHKQFFENPISLDLNFLQQSYAICLNCVKVYNNFIFNSLVSRYVLNNKTDIRWNFNIDRRWFRKYFEIFNSDELNREAESRGDQFYTVKTAYNELRAHNLNGGR